MKQTSASQDDLATEIAALEEYGHTHHRAFLTVAKVLRMIAHVPEPEPEEKAEEPKQDAKPEQKQEPPRAASGSR